MKILQLLIFGLAITALTVRAQDDPGRSQITNSVAPIQAGSGFQTMLQPGFTPLIQTSSAIAEAITPDIQALAGNLGNDPTRIFNYVHDQIRYVHYFGSKKGAELTLLERSGNDFDQCALLSALLQAAGYSPNYQFGMMIIPYDGTNNQDLHHWLGLSMLNTNWSDTLNFFSSFFGARGSMPWIYFTGDSNNIIFQRVWVTLASGGTNYYLDPSFKIINPVAGIVNLTNAMGFSSNALMTAAGGTDAGNYVTGLSESSVRVALQNCSSNLISYLSNNIPNATVAQVIGGQQIVSSSGLPLSTSLAFPLYTNSTYPFLNWTYQPTNFMGTFSISLGGTNQTWFTPQLEGQRISLTFSNNGLAQLWLEDSNILQTANTGTSNTVNVTLSATHPYGAWNTSLNIPVDTGIFDKSSTNAYQRTNSSYAIMYAFEAGPVWLQARQQKLDAYRQQGLPDSSRQVTTETLNVMGLDWMVQTELSLELVSQEWGQLPQHHHRFGRMGQESGHGYYVDVYLQEDGTFPSTGYNPPDILANNEAFDVTSYIWSAMEHGIIEQLQNSNLVAASTVKMIEIASTNSSQAVYMADNANWSSVKSSLVGYSSTTLSTLSNLVGNGYLLLLPQNGTNHVAGTGTWEGVGYVELGSTANQRVMGTVISGGYNGGFVSDPLAVPIPATISFFDDNQFAYFNPQSATLPFSGQTGADPVNLVDGSFEITASDLTLGQTEPRGLNLTRYYSSARRNSNPAGMGPGWLHNYYCNVLPTSAPQLALGNTTPQQMTPMIVATCAALNLYNDVAPDPKNWTVTALIAKWGIDQLINNAVSVNLGKDNLQFVKQPNGVYTPPANCTMSLLQTNGAFWLTERHGRTFKFGGNNLLTNIADQYGQTVYFTYNSNNLVTNVLDWKGRSLTFAYAGGVLTNVADSAGRTISYKYTGADLTSFTDPEQKTNGYFYDTNHEVIATFDATGRVVVTNIYDGFGHVTTQLSQGDPNKTWQIYANGYYTVEVDPAGGEQVFTYDNKSRLIAVQDALGNVAQTVYDGQDHVVLTVSPLNETNRFVYDGNNNLTNVTDALGFTSLFVYDSQNNLIQSTDPRGNASTFGYNSQFSLTGQTNGAGDYVNYTYNSDGTLHTRVDSGGTTTNGYDSFGQLSSMGNLNGLGSESFVNNSLGDPTNHTDANGNVTTFAYNNRRQLTNSVAPTNLISSVAFDAVGNVASVTDARGNATSNTWSATCHLLATILPSTPQGVPVVTNAYDSRDWLARTVDALQHPTFYTNDVAGRLISVTDPVQRTTLFGYDSDGRKLVAVNAANETNSQTWDARGSLLKLTDGAGHFSLRSYDAAGNQIILTNRNTNVWQNYFDKANRLTNTITPRGYSTSMAFNHQGLPASIKDQAGQTTSFNYDGKGRLTNRTDNLATTLYRYDANNNRTNAIEGVKTNLWTFDAYNHVSSYRDTAGNLIQYRYDANGNMTNLIYPGSRTVTYFYDSLNRMTNVTDWSGHKSSISYDLDGHVTSITRRNGSYRTISYDAAGQATNILEQMANSLPIALFKFNWTNSGSMAWEFAAPLPHSVTVSTRTMTYDADNRLATFQLGASSALAVGSDADGNLTNAPLLTNVLVTYTYDARNRLLNAGGVTNAYDALNNRIGQIYGTNAATYVVNPIAKLPQVLMRIKNGVTNYYIYGAGLLYQITEAATGTNTLTYQYDFRGSTIALSGDNGLVTDRIEYSAYGLTTYRAGTNDTPFLFNGRYGVQTDANGLFYMQARYYNPYLCRFLNPDPSGFVAGLNLYAYAYANPVSYLDPSGLQSWMSPGYGSIPNPVSIVPGNMIHTGPIFDSSFGFGVIASGNAEGGYGPPNVGGALNVSAGGGFFYNPTSGASVGGFDAGGSYLGGPFGSLNLPSSGTGFLTSGTFGQSAGVGSGVWISNAGSVSELGGDFTQVNFNYIPNTSLSLAWSGDTWLFSATYGASAGGSASIYPTTTPFAGGFNLMNGQPDTYVSPNK